MECKRLESSVVPEVVTLLLEDTKVLGREDSMSSPEQRRLTLQNLRLAVLVKELIRILPSLVKLKPGGHFERK